MAETAVNDGTNWTKQPDGSIWRWDGTTEQWLQWQPGASDTQPPRKWIKQMEKQAQREAAAKAKDEAAKAKEEAAFWSSPQGRARAAMQAGQKLFQITLPVSTTEKAWFGDSAMFGAPTATRTRESQPGGPLEGIEAEGWRLEHVGYVFQPTGTESRDRLLASGQVETIVGQVIGIYLFRAASTRSPEGERALEPRSPGGPG